MLVTLHGDVKEHYSEKEGYYFLQTDPVNEKPCWSNEGGTAIWYHKEHGYCWWIGAKEDLGGSPSSGIFSPDDVEDPLQALTWKYSDNGWHESKDIFVTKSGII